MTPMVSLRSAAYLPALALALTLAACSSGSSDSAGRAPSFRAPTGLTLDEDSAGRFEITEISGGTLTIETDPPDALATISISEVVDGTATVDLTPRPDLAGIVRVMIRLSDGGQTTRRMLRLALRPFNDPPTLGRLADQMISEDGSASILLSEIGPGGGANELGQAIDVDASIVAAAGVTGALTLTPIAGGARVLGFTPGPDQNGFVDIRVRVVEVATSAEISQTFRLTVQPVNDAPVATGPTALSFDEDSPPFSAVFSLGPGGGTDELGQTVLATADSDTPALFSSITSTRIGDTLRVELTPAPDAFGQANLRLSLDDGEPGGQATIVTPVTILPIADPFELPPQGGSVTLNPGASATVDVPILTIGDPAPNGVLGITSSSLTAGVIDSVSGVVVGSTLRVTITAATGPGPVSTAALVTIDNGEPATTAIQVTRRIAAPAIQNLSVPDPARGQVPIRFEVVQTEGRPVDLRLELDDGTGFRPITPSGLSVKRGTSGLRARIGAPSGRADTVLWDSTRDLGGGLSSGVRVRVTPTLSEPDAAGSAASGPAVTFGPFTVDNRVRLTSPGTTTPTAGEEAVAVDLDLDGELDIVARRSTPASLEISLGDSSAPGGYQAPSSLALTDAPRQLAVIPTGDGGFLAPVTLTDGDELVVFQTNALAPGLFSGTATRSIPSAIDFAAGDLNGDGQPDIAVRTPTGFAIFAQDRATTDGLDSGSTIAESAAGPFAFADVNSDGAADLVFARPGASDLAVRLRDRLNQTFAAPVSLVARTNISAVTIADVDGDSRADLVVTSGAGLVEVFRRDHAAGISFSLFTSFDAGGPALETRVLNLDHRRPLDLVVRRATGQVLAATPRFGSPLALPLTSTLTSDQPLTTFHDSAGAGVLIASSGALELARPDRPDEAPAALDVGLAAPVSRVRHVADLNGDGIPDIVATERRSITVHLGAGDGRLLPPISLDVDATSPEPMVGDFDGDGRPELVVRDDANRLRLTRLTETNPAALTPAVVTPGPFTRPLRVISPGLGRPDLLAITSSTSGPQFISLLAMSPTTPDQLTEIQRLSGVGGNLSADDLWVADLNGDGATDLILRQGTGSIRIGLAITAATPRFAPLTTLPSSVGVQSFAIGDVDGDGRADIVAARFSEPLTTWRQDPAAPGQFLAPQLNGPDISASSLALGDLDSDGRDDVVLVVAGVVRSRLSDPADPGQFLAEQTVAGASIPSRVALADLEADGRLELFVMDDDDLLLFRPGPGASFLAPETFRSEGTAALTDPLFVDLDSDGVREVGYRDRVFRPLAPPPETLARVVGDGETLAAVDFDGDGRHSIIASGTDGIALHRATASGFMTPATSLAGFRIPDFKVGELDGDGLIEILTLHPGNPSRLRPLSIDGALQWTAEPSVVISERPERLLRYRSGVHARPSFFAAGGVFANATVETHSLISVSPAFVVTAFGTFGVGSSLAELEIADVNRDGRDDAVLSDGQSCRVFQQLASGAFSQLYASGDAESVDRLRVARINGDHLPDLVYRASSAVGVTLRVRLNQPANPGTFGPPIDRPAPAGGVREVAARDFDGDGLAEVLLIGNGEGRGYTRDPAALNSILPNQRSIPSFNGRVTSWDSDGDGRPEPVVWSSLAIDLLHNGRRGLFGDHAATIRFSTDQRPAFVAPGDVDGDGRDGLLVLLTSGEILVLRRR